MLCLDDIAYIADFGLGAKSWVDVFVDGVWKSFQIQKHNSIQVEKGREVLIRLRPNLCEGLVDCPGLKQRIAKQGTARTGSSKRPADALISPHKPAKAA